MPLAAHLFIFYFGMMSMVTPPVALAAYTAASIAGSGIMSSGFAAFRFALVGFTLPYLFVFRPELLLLSSDGTAAAWTSVAGAVVVAVLGIVPWAGAVAGYMVVPLSPLFRGLCIVAAMLLLFPSPGIVGPVSWNGLLGAGLLVVLLAALSFKRRGATATG